MMKGRSSYNLPDTKSVRKLFHETQMYEKFKFIDKLAKNEPSMNGIISLTDANTRHDYKQDV